MSQYFELQKESKEVWVPMLRLPRLKQKLKEGHLHSQDHEGVDVSEKAQGGQGVPTRPQVRDVPDAVLESFNLIVVINFSPILRQNKRN